MMPFETEVMATRLAKLSPPKLFAAHPRRRLFTQLDAARASPAIWVVGPPGAGKTTLLASYCDTRGVPVLWYQIDDHDADPAGFFHYLTLAAAQCARRKKQRALPVFAPESHADVAGFARRYFRALFDRLTPPFILVFDNYQEIDAVPALHEAMHEGLLQVPEGINVVVISRGHPPPVFSRLGANGALTSIEWDDLRLTLDEARAIAGDTATDSTVARVHEDCDGWVTGLVLATRRLKHSGNVSAHHHFSTDAKDRIFDYFAGLFLSSAPAETRSLLLRTALLPRFTGDMAKRVSGNGDAVHILESLYRQHFFTYRREDAIPGYQYHALFRDFLIARGNEAYSASERRELAQQTGELLEDDAQIEEAIGCYALAQDWAAVTRLILADAPEMISRGRSKTVCARIAKVPESAKLATPWLFYWNGVSEFDLDPAHSRQELERAFAAFKGSGDTVGTLRAWAWITQAIMLEWGDRSQLDRWIEWLDSHLNTNSEFPDPETGARVAAGMAGALFLRQPDRPDLVNWMDRAYTFAVQSPDTRFAILTAFRIIHFHLSVGEPATAQLIAQWVRRKTHAPDTLPLLQIVSKVVQAYVALVVQGDLGNTLDAIRDGLAIADASGIHMFDHFLKVIAVNGWLSVRGDAQEAGKLLESMIAITKGPQRVEFAEFHYLSAGQALQSNELQRALEHARRAVEIADVVGSLYVGAMYRAGYLQVLHASGNQVTTIEVLDNLYALAIRTASRPIQVVCLLVKAQIGFEQGNDADGVNHLRQAMELSNRLGSAYVLWWWRPTLLADLCVRALDAGIEVEHVQRLVRTLHLVPTEPPLACEQWPWELRIVALGTFEIIKNGESIRFAGKVQQKPLELLKFMIAMGGSGVSASMLIHSIWPDADGDAAQNSFDNTLHRLRKLLGYDKAITLAEGKLSLDPRLVWVDAFAFERMTGRIGPDAIEPLAQRAFRLYRGHFLERDGEEPWMLPVREKLRSRFRRLTVFLGNHWEASGHWGKAAEVYLRGLELDSLAEEFYRRLMICYNEQGRLSEALDVYRRCRQILSVVLGMPPSAETQALHQALRAGNALL